MIMIEIFNWIFYLITKKCLYACPVGWTIPSFTLQPSNKITTDFFYDVCICVTINIAVLSVHSGPPPSSLNRCCHKSCKRYFIECAVVYRLLSAPQGSSLQKYLSLSRSPVTNVSLQTHAINSDFIRLCVDCWFSITFKGLVEKWHCLRKTCSASDIIMMENISNAVVFLLQKLCSFEVYFVTVECICISHWNWVCFNIIMWNRRRWRKNVSFPPLCIKQFLSENCVALSTIMVGISVL